MKVRDLLSTPITVLVTLLGVLSAFVQVFSTPGHLSPLIRATTVLITIGCAAWIAFKIAFGKLRSERGLPTLEVLESLAAPYIITPASVDDVRWAARLAHRVYTGLDVIPETVMLDWYKANPRGFFIIRSRSGHRVGNLDVLALKPTTLERIIDGRVLEREITGDCVFSAAESKQVTRLYVESFVAVTEEGRPNAGAAVQAISDFAKILGHICDPLQIKEVYAIAASANGKKLLRRLGFDLISDAAQRRDGHDLYSASMCDIARNILEILGDRVQSRRIVDLITSIEAGSTVAARSKRVSSGIVS